MVHRDLKPANVLLAPTAEGWVAKVTDFGLAKLELDETASLSSSGSGHSGSGVFDSGDSGALTEAGTVMGTPRYMSPEQHVGDTLTPHTDQYSFCVALWEALCGTPPFVATKAGRLVAHKRAGPPPWPAQESARSVPRSVVAAIRRGLAAAPEDRWPTMDELLAAVDAGSRSSSRPWLAGLSVLAVASAVIALTGSEGSDRCSGGDDKIAKAWNPSLRDTARGAFSGTQLGYADAAWARTETALDAYRDQWVTMHREACEATAIRGEQSAAVMDLRMACLEEARAELGAVTVILADADARTVRAAHNLVEGLPALSRCADVELLTAEVEPPAPAEADDVAQLRDLLAQVRAALRAGRPASARDVFDRVEPLASAIEYPPVKTEVVLARGRLLEDSGHYAEAELEFRRAMELAGEHRQWTHLGSAARELAWNLGVEQERFDAGLRFAELAAGLSHDDEITRSQVHNTRGTIYKLTDRLDEAEAELREGLQLREAARGPEHHSAGTMRNNIANLLTRARRYSEAEAEHRKALAIREAALGPEHPDVAQSRNNLANALRRQGKVEEAIAEHRKALEIRLAVFGPEHPEVADSRSNLGNALEDAGQMEEAIEQFQQAVEITIAELGFDHPSVNHYLTNLGITLKGEGRYEDAEAAFRRAIESTEARPVHEHPVELARSLSYLGLTLEAMDRTEEAEAQHRRAIAHLIEELGPDHVELSFVRYNLGLLLLYHERYDESQAELRKSLDLLERADPPDEDDLTMTRGALADALVHLRRYEEALPLAELAYQARKDSSAYRAWDALVLAQALWEAGTPDQRPRALELTRIAKGDFERAQAEGRTVTESLAETNDWLRTHGG
jgi:tetratricopeptide (TPR) repeat protein